MRKWQELKDSPEFKSLSAEDQHEIQKAYIENATSSLDNDNDKEVVKQEFFKTYPSALQSQAIETAQSKTFDSTKFKDQKSATYGPGSTTYGSTIGYGKNAVAPSYAAASSLTTEQMKTNAKEDFSRSIIDKDEEAKRLAAKNGYTGNYLDLAPEITKKERTYDAISTATIPLTGIYTAGAKTIGAIAGRELGSTALTEVGSRYIANKATSDNVYDAEKDIKEGAIAAGIGLAGTGLGYGIGKMADKKAISKAAQEFGEFSRTADSLEDEIVNRIKRVEDSVGGVLLEEQKRDLFGSIADSMQLDDMAPGLRDTVEKKVFNKFSKRLYSGIEDAARRSSNPRISNLIDTQSEKMKTFVDDTATNQAVRTYKNYAGVKSAKSGGDVYSVFDSQFFTPDQIDELLSNATSMSNRFPEASGVVDDIVLLGNKLKTAYMDPSSNIDVELIRQKMSKAIRDYDRLAENRTSSFADVGEEDVAKYYDEKLNRSPSGRAEDSFLDSDMFAEVYDSLNGADKANREFIKNSYENAVKSAKQAPLPIGSIQSTVNRVNTSARTPAVSQMILDNIPVKFNSSKVQSMTIKELNDIKSTSLSSAAIAQVSKTNRVAGNALTDIRRAVIDEMERRGAKIKDTDAMYSNIVENFGTVDQATLNRAAKSEEGRSLLKGVISKAGDGDISNANKFYDSLETGMSLGETRLAQNVMNNQYVMSLQEQLKGAKKSEDISKIISSFNKRHSNVSDKILGVEGAANLNLLSDIANAIKGSSYLDRSNSLIGNVTDSIVDTLYSSLAAGKSKLGKLGQITLNVAPTIAGMQGGPITSGAGILASKVVADAGSSKPINKSKLSEDVAKVLGSKILSAVNNFGEAEKFSNKLLAQKKKLSTADFNKIKTKMEKVRKEFEGNTDLDRQLDLSMELEELSKAEARNAEELQDYIQKHADFLEKAAQRGYSRNGAAFGGDIFRNFNFTDE